MSAPRFFGLALALALELTTSVQHQGAAGSTPVSQLNDTDWLDARVSDAPVLPGAANISACVALCAARDDCVAVSWSGPGSAPVRAPVSAACLVF
jgi:hypothetical protein